ncbi:MULTISPECIES: FlgD immunoglobulin-like domain containing protein [Reichenbachiella]|uniref:FlgD immunoglobulin-like domain containing protein n=1 Tax=Reichenbachiella TaxID=156993 RepID=UPI000E6B57EB|nr:MULTISPECIES: FlgD immunoglobulin-like domain containing protein [Reichenbachiella]MBU2914196.1 T9SS type A sorting domain-containing protein [Reichenbachiella agariperforans]RJE72931.1 hypothetical protein BGP76_03000 [Reichenbachiella sp. MSK19-1]
MQYKRLINCQIAITVTLIIAFASGCQQERVERKEIIIDAPSAIGTEEDPHARAAFERMQLVDPATHEIPELINQHQVNYARQVLAGQNHKARVTASEWRPLGPVNVGGRTRALAIDVTDENIWLAGAVSGGMYRSTDQGINWERTTHPAMLNSVTCIAQDTRPGFEHIWYYGTGELRGSSSRASGAPYRGDGIYRSVDGGETWDVLVSTSMNRPADFESPFNYVWDIVVDQSGSVYAALYGCVVKSDDGGQTWDVVLGPDLLHPELFVPPIEDLNESGAPFYTSVLLTDAGQLYASMSSFTALGYRSQYAGVYRRNAVDVWEEITPFGFPIEHDRTVMTYSPSQENWLYVLTESASLNFWRFDGTNWQNRSQYLPAVQDTLPAIDTQDSYNVLARAHPLDPNIVFLGGTNLYRSTNGFSSSDQTTWIGGYDPDGTTAAKYPGHHPDQHELLFMPSDPNQVLSANDGGVRYTSQILAPKVTWQARNKGYVSSQFYTIALSKDEESNKAIGGMQDNGTYMKVFASENSSWKEILGGDGSYAATTPEEKFWYVSFQSGQTYRLTLNKENELTSFAEVDPVGGEGYLFINPYILDPNNYNRMYMAAGRVVWRNDNLQQIPSGKQNPTSVNWSQIASTEGSSSAVSSLDISTHPAHVLYHGTSYGAVFKTIYANTDTAQTDFVYQHVIQDDAGRESSGYISSIAIDPTDAQRTMFTYSNYHFPSVFFTPDGGQTVVDVSGNMEENPDGSGGGSSVRWCEIVPLQNGSYLYFLGTSTGLYSTTALDGAQTVWVKEADESIGNSVVSMLDYRSSDGKLIAATHGNGTFETNIEGTLEITPEPVEGSIEVLTAYPNPFEDQVTVLFSIPESGRAVVQVLNSAGQLIKTILNAEQFAGEVSVTWDGTNATGTPVDPGMYFYRVYYDGALKSGKLLYRN